MIKKLLEGKKIDSDYEKSFSEIERDIFDKIIALDPQTNIEADRVGPCSKQLLLPQYLQGETEFLDDADNVKKALELYISKRGEFPQALRNITAFPTVKDFVDYVLNGEESDFAKRFDLTDLESQPKEKESKIDTIYNKYYKDLSREDFDKIIALDPETTENSIGQAAKNLLLPRAMKGEKVLDLDSSDITNAIIKFNDEKSKYPEDKRQIEKFDSVEEFVNYVLAGPESNFVKKLKSCEWEDDDTGNKVKDDIVIIGSTAKYDIIQPLSWAANNAITCNCEHRRRDTEYFTWCTGWSGDTSQWDSHSSREYIYCFIDKSNPAPTNAKDRESSYQLAIRKTDSTVYQFLDGNDKAYGDFNAGQEKSTRFFVDFLKANPDVCKLLSTKEHLKENKQVQEVMELIKYTSGKPFICDGEEEAIKFKQSQYSTLIKEIICKNMTRVPAACFSQLPALQKVQFNPEIKVIEAEAFMGCITLNNIVLPPQLEKIGPEAFAQCLGLRSTIQIPDSLTQIGREAFRGAHCKLSINKARTNKLEVNVADRQWFISHAKGITVQEGLEENMINEDVLDEKLPRDLAAAYKNSYAAERGIQRHPHSDHQEIGHKVRKQVRYAYDKATYEEISKEEAVEYLGLSVNIEPERDENGKIVAKVRTTDREGFNQKISNLRFIIDNRVVEYEVREGNRLYLAYWTNIPDSYFTDYPTFVDKSGYATGDVRYGTKYSDVYTIIQIADKIYKTDEYEFEITSETPTGKKIKTTTIQDGGEVVTNVVDDTIYNRRQRNKEYQTIKTLKGKDEPGYQIHNPAGNLKYKYAPKGELDTGAHNILNDNALSYELRSSIKPYFEKRNEVNKAKKKYDYLRSYLKKVEDEREYYDDAEFNDLTSTLKQRKEDAYKEYLDLNTELKQIKQNTLLSLDDITAKHNKSFADNIKIVSDTMNAINSNMTKQSNLLSKVVSYDSEEKRDLERKIRNQKDRIESTKSDIESWKRRKADLLRQIQDLDKSVETGTASIEDYVKKLDEFENEMSTISDTVMKKKFAQLDALRQEQQSLQAELDALTPRTAADRAARAAKNKEKELDTSLADIIQFVDGSEEETAASV